MFLPLVNKTIAGDREALELLLLSQKTFILRLIKNITSCREDIEDISQEVSFRVFQHIESLKHPEAFGSWLRTIVVRECRRHFSAKNRCLSVETVAEWENHFIDTDSDCNPFANMERLELNSAIKTALESLRDPIRKMFYMRYDNDMCCREVAASTGMKTGTVSVTMFRAKKILREKLYSGIVDA